MAGEDAATADGECPDTADGATGADAPDFSRARADAVVAGGAALSTVALTLALRFGAGVDASFVVRLSPLSAYALYAITRRGAPHGPFDAPRYWALLSGVVAAVAFLVLTL